MRVIHAFSAVLVLTYALCDASWGETGYPSLPYNDEESSSSAPSTAPAAPAAPAAPSSRTRRETREVRETRETRDRRDNRDARAPQDSRRKFFNDDSKRVDAGVFHVGFAAGGNFYTEPQFEQLGTGQVVPTGDYYKDFGFQAGIYFDHDYSELDENIPLMLRGMIGYKYILSSVHVFTFDGMVRRMWRFSEHASFGLGLGGSAAVWYRTSTPDTISASADLNAEEIIFLPSFVIGAGFEFDPFMVDFKWLINRFGADSTITGLELYFGFRL